MPCSACFLSCTGSLWVKPMGKPMATCTIPAIPDHSEDKMLLEPCWLGSSVFLRMLSYERPVQSWPADWLWGGGVWLCLVRSSAILGDTGTCCRAVCAHLPPCALWVGMRTHPQPALVGMQTQSHTDSTSLAAAKTAESDWFLCPYLTPFVFLCLLDFTR